MSHHILPSFQSRQPLGNGFPAGKNQRPSLQMARSPTAKPHSGARGPDAGSKHVEDEYIRNLQQQIYLLELETRYLRAPKNDGDVAPGGEPTGTTMPLNDAIKTLKHKYIELQDTNKKEITRLEDQIEMLRSQNEALVVTMAMLEKERDEARDQMRETRETQITEKDKIYGEVIALRKKMEIIQADHNRMEAAHKRMIKEKQEMQALTLEAEANANKWKDQVEEQLHINQTLKSRIEELHKLNTQLQTKLEDADASMLSWDIESQKVRIAELMREKIDLQTELKQIETVRNQDEHMRLKIQQDCSELIKVNVTLKAELDDTQRRLRKEFEQRDEKGRRRQDQAKEVEIMREELAKIRDDLSMAKISVDNKDRKLSEVGQQLRATEAALAAANEARSAFEERIRDLDSRLQEQEHELIQLGQDKSLLIDDVAELRNANEINQIKLVGLQKDKKELTADVEKYQKEMSKRRELEELIGKVEMSGENYLHLMKNVKNYLANKPLEVDDDETDIKIYTGLKAADPTQGSHASQAPRANVLSGYASDMPANYSKYVSMGMDQLAKGGGHDRRGHGGPASHPRSAGYDDDLYDRVARSRPERAHSPGRGPERAGPRGLDEPEVRLDRRDSNLRAAPEIHYEDHDRRYHDSSESPTATGRSHREMDEDGGCDRDGRRRESLSVRSQGSRGGSSRDLQDDGDEYRTFDSEARRGQGKGRSASVYDHGDAPHGDRARWRQSIPPIEAEDGDDGRYSPREESLKVRREHSRASFSDDRPARFDRGHEQDRGSELERTEPEQRSFGPSRTRQRSRSPGLRAVGRAESQDAGSSA
ncbi:uncharacterized protein BJ171DRAFT_111617 [Polychytrium aggregatum]|uniref:uncharacterized protein n=1 Tax=Polychytrium aggregatum TaxID=110093 RepID=UPI0022FF13C6|nr:uncharacterized protein BJ171DRAFT_111617 [Polychytrium aggregatum]KAI9209238.1 hypothetical protein BJ171DRAFT_111617 [Polychytrium aggregatum]